MDAHVSELYRLLNNLIRVGAIAEVDGIRARVKIGEITTTWLRWMPARAGNATTWWRPSAGEQVVVLSPGGDMGMGMILPALYSDEFPAPSDNPDLHITDYPDGTRVQYDSASHALSIIVVGGTVNIHAVDGVTINASDGNVVINGDVVANGISLCNHTHSGVVPGGASTGGPQ